MCSDETGAMTSPTGGLATLAGADVVALDDQTLRTQLLEAVQAANRVYAETLRRVDVFDRRQQCHDDGFKTSKAWLRAYTGMSGPAAHRLVEAARVLRQLPRLAAMVASGKVSEEHVRRVQRLAAQLGVATIAEVDATLADAAVVLDVAGFELVCERVRAHVDPDGSDPARDFDKRALSLSPVGGMMSLRGQLDPEGGAALAAALDALMVPPADGDPRSAAQRRADALVELARLHLAAGELPTVGGQRPQVGVLLFPQALSPETLAKLADAQRDSFAAQRLREFLNPDPATDPAAETAADPAVDSFGRTSQDMRRGLIAPEPERTDTTEADAAEADAAEADAAEADTAEVDTPQQGQAQVRPGWLGPVAPAGAAQAADQAQDLGAVMRPTWSRAGWADPPYLDWLGPVAPEVAQRLACDSDIFRVVLDPASGMPLDVGRAHRLVPYWIRRALYARDRTCRWPGCHAPAQWTDAHYAEVAVMPGCGSLVLMGQGYTFG